MSDARWGSEDNPLVDCDGLLVLVFLDGDVSSEEQQRERGDLGAVIEEDLKRDGDIVNAQSQRYYRRLTCSVTGSGIVSTC